MSVKKIIACCLVIAFPSLGCDRDDTSEAVRSAATEEHAAVGLAGTYKCEAFSMVFDKGKCICVSSDGKDRTETEYLIEEDKVYIAPIVPKGNKMTRNVWVVYTIKGNTLESSHVEDMDTRDVFYKGKKPPIILTRE